MAKKKKCFYIVQGFDLGPSLSKKMTQGQMVKHAKKQLKISKEAGFDKGVTQRDLSRPINAWVYLKNIGLGVRTNCREWK